MRNRRGIYLLTLLIIIMISDVTGLYGQSTFRSFVINPEEEALIGAIVKVQGTEDFAITDIDGSFELKTLLSEFDVEISYLGYKRQKWNVSSNNFPETFIMEVADNRLNEIVVTALGIKREKKALTSSVAEIGAIELSKIPQTNMVNSLSGKVSGVQITNGSSGIGSSSRIVIRGENSLGGNNEPLFVVDGVPISNQLITSDLVNNGSFQEVDFGNGAAEFSPDDIESISILKGAGSAALYGSRAANGVVLITTKKGKKNQGIGISVNSSLTVESLLTLVDYQNVYGGGSNGEYSFQNGAGAGVNDGGLASFGPKLDQGLLINQFDSPSMGVDGSLVRAGDVNARLNPDGTYTSISATPWVSNPNNVRDFYETGVTSQNNFAISSGTDLSNFRVSYSNLRNKGILPNTGLKRDGISMSYDHQILSNLRFDGFLNYINSRSENRPNLGYGYENVNYGFNWTGRQTDISAMKDYWQVGQESKQHFDINYLWLTNPYLTLFENTNGFNKNRVLGNGALTFDIIENLSLRVRTGIDIYNDGRAFKRVVSTNRNPFGSYREDEVKYREINTDVLLSYNDRWKDNIQYSVSLGANRFDQSIGYKFTEASQLAIPNVYSIENSRNPLKGTSQFFTKRINSIYGIGTVSFNSSLYFDLSLRNDWSSTLPADNNSFVYYSAGVSYVLSNAFELPKDISFLKINFNASRAGNDTDPYQLNNSYLFNQNYGSDFRVTNETVLKNVNLKPERLEALEVGLETWFFGSRLQLELSAYQNTSINQIIARPISISSGYSNAIENGGKISTRGLEARLSGKIIDREFFSWISTLNFTNYRSKVLELPEGTDQVVTGTADIFGGNGGANTVYYMAKEDGRVGDMYGTGFVEIDGNTLYGSNGLPVQSGQLKLLGNYNPDFILGLGNEFSYKSITLNFLFDWRSGGTIVSRTKALGSTSGVLEETLVGRESGIIGDGVMNIGTAESPDYVPNTTIVSASTYYNNYYDRGNEASALYDASYVKLRQVGVYYRLSDEMSKKIGCQDLSIGLVGNNLLLFTENPHFDPELNGIQGRNFTYGVEDITYPSTRSIGVSIKTNF